MLNSTLIVEIHLGLATKWTRQRKNESPCIMQWLL